MAHEDLKALLDKTEAMLDSIDVEAAMNMARGLWDSPDGKETLGLLSTGAGMALLGEDQSQQHAAELLQTAALRLTRSEDFKDKNIGLNIMRWMIGDGQQKQVSADTEAKLPDTP